jgi:hypothetical protein
MEAFGAHFFGEFTSLETANNDPVPLVSQAIGKETKIPLGSAHA